tara:strand:+ start:473 stop:880 length:408 start_codon:yes stop_codon:yes gene_type:complete
MMMPGDIFLKIFGFVCAIAFVVVVSALIGYGFLQSVGECAGYLFSSGSCSSGLYQLIADYSYTVLIGTTLTVFPAILAIIGFFWLLRNIHHRQTNWLIAQDRVDETIRLRTFFVKWLGLGLITIIAVFVVYGLLI